MRKKARIEQQKRGEDALKQLERRLPQLFEEFNLSGILEEVQREIWQGGHVTEPKMEIRTEDTKLDVRMGKVTISGKMTADLIYQWVYEGLILTGGMYDGYPSEWRKVTKTERISCGVIIEIRPDSEAEGLIFYTNRDEKSFHFGQPMSSIFWLSEAGIKP